MTVFNYDSTFEGLLTAIFDAYSRRQFPDVLLPSPDCVSPSHPAHNAFGSVSSPSLPLFSDEIHNVLTDSAKSGRVWRALLKKLPKEVCNMLFYGWLSEESGVDMMLFRYIRRVFDEPATTSSVATDFSDPDILRVKQLALKVSHECEHIRQFTRFQKGGDAPGNDTTTGPADSYGAGATYFAPVSPRYNALPLAIGYFRDRFRDQRWLIYDIKRRYGFYYDLKEVTEVTMEDDAHLVAGKLDEAMMAADEKLFQDLWRTYFHSMAIAERINPKLQRQHMPKRFWALLTELQ